METLEDAEDNPDKAKQIGEIFTQLISQFNNPKEKMDEKMED